jgi:MFS family permease
MVATALQGLSSGIWAVIFNLYLNLKAVGFQPDFIGLMFTVSAIATGLVALPAGLLCERLGPKKALLIGFMANFVNLAQIVILQPSILLVASLSSGLIGTVAWVAAAPFMMENSTQEERTYFFSVDWAIMIIMGVIGNYVGGLMPNLLNTFLGLPTGANGSPIGCRISLGISMALALTMVIPVLLIKEDRMLQRQKISDLISFRNIRSHRTILKFMVPTAMIGFGAGFIVPLFNLFFSLKFSASLEQIGLISSLSSITLGIGTLVAPALSKRLGRVKSIVVCEFLSMPFIMLMTLAPNLALASSAFITRNALMNMAGPISSTLQMELVTETERATTNGLMVMADGVPRALTAWVSGRMMTESDFYTPFLITTLTYFIASSLYFMFFRKAETQIAKAGSENVR